MHHHEFHEEHHKAFGPTFRRTVRRRGPIPPPPFGGFGPPFGRPFGPPFGRGRGFGPGGPRARRGDVRAAILALLAERPMHGYEIIQELESRTRGVWRPSAGSVYPTLQLLEDEGLVVSTEEDGKRAYALTEAGRTQQAESGRAAPWEDVIEGVEPDAHQLRESGMQLAAAVAQVLRAGDPAQREAAAGILTEARRRIYALLAEEPEES